MEVKDCVSAVESKLYDARRYLETGKAVNWVPDSLESALHWAMEAWLIGHGHEINRGKGWEGVQTDFWNAAPPELRTITMSCLSRAVFLEYDLEGGFDHKEPLPPIDVWEKEAYACLERTEEVLACILKDLPHA